MIRNRAVTVLAPSNEAFKKLDDDAIDSLIEDEDLAGQVENFKTMAMLGKLFHFSLS